MSDTQHHQDDDQAGDVTSANPYGYEGKFSQDPDAPANVDQADDADQLDTDAGDQLDADQLDQLDVEAGDQLDAGDGRPAGDSA